MHKEQIKSVEDKGYRDKVRHSHPSFGLFQVMNTQGDQRLFGSEVKTSSNISIRIHFASVTQIDGKNQYMSKERIADVQMTPVQYAEAISNPNQMGVPCTIRYTETLGHIEPENIETATQHAISQVDNHIIQTQQKVSDLKSQIAKIISKKGALNAAEKAEINKLTSKLEQDVGVNFEYYQQQALENIERATMEAKGEISAHITHAVNSAGVEALKDPEVAKLALGVVSEHNKVGGSNE